MVRYLLAAFAVLTFAAGARATTPVFTGSASRFAGIYSNDRAYLTVSLGTHGKFTGAIDVSDGVHDTIRGTVDSTGFYSGTTAGSSKTPYTIQITGSDENTYQLLANAVGKQITAYPAAYAKGVSTSPEAGRYNLLLSNTDTSPSSPQGIGYAGITVNKAGIAAVTGKLADGTSFTASGVIVRGGNGDELIVFDRNIYRKTGVIGGVVYFDPMNCEGNMPNALPENDIAYGSFAWDKPPATAGQYYPAGFSTRVVAEGGGYSRTDGLPFASGTLSITGPYTLTEPFTLTSNGVATVSGTNDVKLRIATATGSVSGSFKEGAKVIKLQGALLQNDATAQGFYLTPVSTSPRVDGTGLSGAFSMQ